MSATFEDLKILRSAEEISDSIWKRVVEWDDFAKDVVGKQIAKSADSIGANIAESFGRFNYGEKLQFLYYARGSLFETKYWLNRTKTRGLLHSNEVQVYVDNLTGLARQLNTFASGLKTVKSEHLKKKSINSIRENRPEYVTADLAEIPIPFISEDDLSFLAS